jgi:hypothetical protein
MPAPTAVFPPPGAPGATLGEVAEAKPRTEGAVPTNVARSRELSTL